MFLEAEVAALSGGWVFGPDPSGGRGLHHCAAQRAPASGEQLTGGVSSRGGQPLSGAGAFGLDPGEQGGQHRQPLAGALVHAGLALRAVLLVGGVAGADRAAHRPRPPPGRVVVGPLGDVQVERAHRAEHAEPVQPGRGRGHGRAAGASGGPGPHHHPLFPGGGNLAGQLEGVNAGVVGLQVSPEQLAEQISEALQRGEVHRRLTLAQIVHEQVTHRPALDPVAVDQLLAGRPAAPGEHLDRGGRVRAETAAGAQQLVEQRAVRVPVAVAVGSGDIEQFHAVPDHDVGGHATLGSHDHRDSCQRLLPGQQPHRPAGAHVAEGRERRVVAGAAHLRGQAAPGRGEAEQPAQAGPDHIGADQHQQTRSQVRQPRAVADRGSLLGRGADQLLPVRVCFGAAGQPLLLPAVPGLGMQPVQHAQHTQPASLLAEPVRQRERRRQHPAQHLAAAGLRRRPGHGDRPGREPGHQLRARGRGHRCRRGRWRPRQGRPVGPGQRGHGLSCPNSTLRLSAR